MKLNAIFSSNMVFAANKNIRIYGEGRGDAKITFAGKSKEFTSDENAWLVEFEPMEYGGPYELVAEFENETVTLKNIYIGEVYLFAGQSNMQFKLSESSATEDLYESNENLRLFSTDRIEKSDRFTPVDGWVSCKKDEAQYWSALAYFIGMNVAKAKNVAVGAIVCYQGASIIESWVPEGTFEKIGIDIDISKKYHDHTEPMFAEWNQPGVLYSYGFSQVVPFNLSGVVWYQGESDTSIDEAKVYKNELAEMIKIWRNDLKNPSLPFIVVQIANFEPRNDEAWKLLQQQQLEVQEIVPNVTTVISADVCETDDIHPPTKHILAKRIADVILK